MSSAHYKIIDLSRKIAAYTGDTSRTTKHIDQEVIQQDLTYNISHILTELSLALIPTQITRKEILETIDNYNQDNGSKITLDHLMNIGWLRLINEAYLIPGAINSLMWFLDTKDKDEKNRIPKGMEAEAKVLLEILKRMNALKKSAIDPITVKRIIKAITPSIDTAFLFDKKIISSNAKGKLYYRQSNDYSGQLKERIISLAFIKLFPEEVDLPGFRKFINFIHFIGQWPDRLEDYLPYETIQRIKHLCWEILTTDSDLSYPERELRNDQLDAASYRHKSLDIEVPDYVTTQLDPYGFLLEMRHYRFYDHELFSHHESRYTYTLLIRLLIQFDKNQEQPFSVVKELLKTHQNPFIKYQLLYEIIEQFPIVLPYFMDDPELAPLFFDSIGRLKVDKTWLNEGEGIQVNGPAASKIKNILWIEGFDIFLEKALTSSDPASLGKAFAAILMISSREVFSFNTNNYYQSTISHKIFQERYSEVLKKLGTAKMSLKNHYPEPFEKPLLLKFILPEMFRSIENMPAYPAQNELLGLEQEKLDVYIELLRLSTVDFSCQQDHFITEQQLLEQLPELLAQRIYDQLVAYLTISEVDIYRPGIAPERRKARRGVGDFGFEILDMGLVFVHFYKDGLLEMLDEQFKLHLNFNLDPDQYYEHDRDEARKVAIYLKLLLIGYITLNKQQDSRQMESFPLAETLLSLQEMIAYYALGYNKDQPDIGLHDIFSSRRYYFSESIYSQPLVSMLYEALNSFPVNRAKQFIDEYFNENKDLAKLFSAVNRVKDAKINHILTEKIEQIDPDSFIKSAFTVTEIESVLIEIVNSSTLFRFAPPFLKSIEEHAENRKIDTPQKRIFLFKIKLLLALKNKDTDMLQKIEVPKETHNPSLYKEENNRKQYYLGLDQFYNKKNYPQAIKIFDRLAQLHPGKVEYAFYLYQSTAFRDLETQRPSDAKVKWESFKETVTAEENSSLESYLDLSNSIDLLYYHWESNHIKFDQIINTLSPVHLYQEHLIGIIYRNYVNREMYDVAYKYLSQGIAYLKKTDIQISNELEMLMENAFDDKLIEKISATLAELRSLPPKNLPLVFPKILNSKRKLDEFILGEIISGMRIMRKKVKAIETIVKEDHFNDVFLATLRLRFPVYGWEIADQERTGSSGSGIDAGEADIVIKAGGVELALVEALKMAGKDYTKLEEHVLKCGDYSRDLSAYYMVVYYHGHRDKFDHFVQVYQKDVASIPYPSKWAFRTQEGFVDLNSSYDDTENMYIARTIHGGSKYQLYHLIIDMSTKPVIV